MSTLTQIKRLFGGLGAVLLVLVLGYLLIRPFHLRWGASDADVTRTMPGDMQAVDATWTRVIDIAATPEQIWPWVAQWGQGRGGWYSYDWLENLLGFQIHTADRVLPEYQHPTIGDSICLMPGFCGQVFIVEPGRFLGWQIAPPNGAVAWTFIIGIYPQDSGQTRVIIRESIAEGALPAAALAALEPADEVMEIKALYTLKDRAEGYVEPPLITGLEIGLWIAALIPGLVAGVLMLRRKAWALPLAFGLGSLALLLALSFLFLPLWLRAALDVCLWAGMLWLVRKK
jgi:hypothetical protein